MMYKFTARAEKAIEIANDIAMELGHKYIGTEHILYGLCKEGTGIASKVLENQNITDEDILNDYRIYNDKRKVARIHGITVKELNEILKRNPEVEKQ